MDLSQRILALRNRLNLSQEKFGELVGKSQRTVAAWEAGARSPSFNVLCSIADTLNVSVDYLLGRTEIPNVYFDTKKEPTVDDDGLRACAINRVSGLSDPALARVLDFLSGLEAGLEIGSSQEAAPDPDAGSSR